MGVKTEQIKTYICDCCGLESKEEWIPRFEFEGRFTVRAYDGTVSGYATRGQLWCSSCTTKFQDFTRGLMGSARRRSGTP